MQLGMEGYLGHQPSGDLVRVCFQSYFVLCLSSVSDPDKRLQALWVVCDKLPKNNKTNLRLVYTHMRKTHDSKALVFLSHVI